MDRLIQALLTDRPVVTDGAWGTELQARGLPVGACADEWNLSHPDRVGAVARAYAAAGSRVLLTNTFQANRIALARHGLQDRGGEINRAGVEISRRAGACARVFGSIGPTGVKLDTGAVSSEEVRAVFQEQAEALAEAGADALIVETMTDLGEAELAVRAARETGLPVVACMACAVGQAAGAARGGVQTMMGVTLEQAAAALSAAGADVIGANCGTGAAALLPVCEQFRAATDRPLWMKPSAGLPERAEGDAGRLVYRATPEEFAADAQALVKAGADFIGGCCGTRPEFIRALVRALEIAPLRAGHPLPRNL